MAFTVRPATLSDVPAMARAHDEALSHLNDLYAAFFTLPIDKAFLAATEAAVKNAKDTLLVAEQVDTGIVGGFIRYQMMPAASAEPESEQDGQQQQQQPQQQPPEEQKDVVATPSPFARKEHLEEMWQKLNARWDEMEACEKEAVKGQRYAYVKHLMIDPKWQRRGLGTMLLKEVLAMTDAQGIPCFIVSSLESEKLYAKLGFQELGKWVIDDEYWATQIVQHERDLGMTGNEKLVDQFAGVREVEKCMLRMPSN